MTAWSGFSPTFAPGKRPDVSGAWRRWRPFWARLDLVIVKPYLINASLNLITGQIERGVKSLTAYYAHLGFSRIPDLPLMVLDLDYVRPTAYEAGYQE